MFGDPRLDSMLTPAHISTRKPGKAYCPDCLEDAPRHEDWCPQTSQELPAPWGLLALVLAFGTLVLVALAVCALTN